MLIPEPIIVTRAHSKSDDCRPESAQQQKLAHLDEMWLKDGRSLGFRCRMNLSRLSTWGRSFKAVVACAGRISCSRQFIIFQAAAMPLGYTA